MSIVETTKKIENALRLFEAGDVVVVEKTGKATGRGRPPVIKHVKSELGEVELTTAEYNTLLNIQKSVVETISVTKSMTDAEFAEMCRLAVPQLMDRAIKLAMISSDPKEVMAVAKEITDRGYGKVAKHQEEHIPEEADYLRRSWADMPTYEGINNETD
jgi:hypothetical protein